jgi:hypothetical protein
MILTNKYFKPNIIVFYFGFFLLLIQLYIDYLFIDLSIDMLNFLNQEVTVYSIFKINDINIVNALKTIALLFAVISTYRSRRIGLFVCLFVLIADSLIALVNSLSVIYNPFTIIFGIVAVTFYVYLIRAGIIWRKRACN